MRHNIGHSMEDAVLLVLKLDQTNTHDRIVCSDTAGNKNKSSRERKNNINASTCTLDY